MGKQDEAGELESSPKSDNDADATYRHDRVAQPIVWRNVFSMSALHVLGTYAFVYAIYHCSWKSWAWAYSIAIIAGFGVLAGSHRLWTHRCYKAKWPLRVLLMVLQTMSLQNDIYEWARDHRVHHKYSETDADPHNSRRGFFFAHMGWLLVRKHPQVKIKGALVDMSDLWRDPVVRFQRRFYIPLVIIFWLLFPISVPVYFWNESIYLAVCGNFARYFLSLHQAWFVNSAAHLWGKQPFDKRIQPRECDWVSWLSMGEGYHNYHHAFPYDYSASELGWRGHFNPATAFIDFFAWMGQAYDLKKVPEEVIRKRREAAGVKYRDGYRMNPIKSQLLGVLYVSWGIWLFLLLRYCLGIPLANGISAY